MSWFVSQVFATREYRFPAIQFKTQIEWRVVSFFAQEFYFNLNTFKL